MGGPLLRASLPTAVLTVLACAPLGRAGQPVPALPEAASPQVRVGLVVGQPMASIGGGAALRLTHPDGSAIGRIAAGTQAIITPGATGLRIDIGGVLLPPAAAVVVMPESTGSVRVGDREYRGRLEVVIGSAGMVVANRVSVEDYLVGVVTAEMGRRGPDELEALRAQAIVSRTVAIRAIGRAPERGFDLLGTVSDQAYLGIQGEEEQGHESVVATRGLVLTHAGGVIDAFYHSTCGGRTAEPAEVFAGAAGRPYLRSVSDQGPDGRDYCASSPRYRWREEWSAADLLATLRVTLPRGTAAVMAEVLEVSVARRGSTGRVLAITVTHSGGPSLIEGANRVREVLRPPGGGILRSADFQLQVTGVAGGSRGLAAEGRGAGHGVGLCQWGAIGRARAGARFAEILAAYFPGAGVSRLY